MKQKIKVEDLIIFENEDYFALNKPPHIATLADRNNPGNSMLEWAKGYSADAQACHRLDKETSGVILFAKNPDAYRHASMQFEHRNVTKFYHAIVNGVHDLQCIQVFLPLHTTASGYVKIDRTEGKEAETFFNTLKAYRKHTLVECIPVTGRMHQIRVHLSVLKASIVADETYGGDHIYLSQIKNKFKLKNETEEQPLINRVALHAHVLNFMLPSEERVEIMAPYPKDMRALITQLERHS